MQEDKQQLNDAQNQQISTIQEQKNNNSTQKSQNTTKQVTQLIDKLDLNKQGNEEQLQSPRSEDKQSSQNENKAHEIYQTKSFVEINRSEIVFGKNNLFPGSIEEVDVVIGLKEQAINQNTSLNPLMLRVIAKCNNQEFNELDEYVFSVRSNERFEYFQEVRFKIRRKEKAQVKVAVKIPQVRQNHLIDGFLEIQLQNLTPLCLPITAKCEVPKIICIKELYKPDEDTQLIKIPAKRNQPRMPPIPFKNMSNFNFTLEVETIAHQSFAQKAYDIVTQNFVNCQANGQFFVNLQLKENINFKGTIPARDTLRKILVLKIKNSSVFYHYPIEVKVFEGANQSTMS